MDTKFSKPPLEGLNWEVATHQTSKGLKVVVHAHPRRIALCYSEANAGLYNSPVQSMANAKIIAAAPELLEALIAITTNKFVSLGDLIYQVRDREGNGWEGEEVVKWSDAIKKIEKAIKKATE